ncbi:MAG TPA: PepSY-associated TM helix domain-containing protein, partial [Terriglobales bacterium]|nr:PepSY-associated TM helix domain-containing protein [Terriglobales bacterium]
QVAGIYSIVFFLLLCSTGAYFGWRAQIQEAIAAVFPMGVFNQPAPRVEIPPNAEAKSISSFLPSVREQVPNYPIARVLFPEQAGQPIRFMVYEGSRRESQRASNLFYNPFTGELLRADLYHNQLPGDRLLVWIPLIHFGAFGSFLMKMVWAVGGMLFPLMAITGAIMFVGKSKPQS